MPIEAVGSAASATAAEAPKRAESRPVEEEAPNAEETQETRERPAELQGDQIDVDA